MLCRFGSPWRVAITASLLAAALAAGCASSAAQQAALAATQQSAPRSIAATRAFQDSTWLAGNGTPGKDGWVTKTLFMTVVASDGVYRVKGLSTSR